METQLKDEPNDDIFAYEGAGWRQCISGFGRSAVESIVRAVEGDGVKLTSETRETIAWHIGELVRWCRHFNGECQKLQAEKASDDGKATD